MVYFKEIEFNILKFIQNLKLSKKKQNRVKYIFELNKFIFIKKWKNEEVIFFHDLMDLIEEVINE